MTDTDSKRVQATLLLREPRQPERHHVLTPEGVNTGGSCNGCGGALGFWYTFKVCNKCL